MKKISKIIALFALSALMIPSCDIVEEPYLVAIAGGNGPGPGDKVRKVLLEDYTGQKCLNCPEAAEIAHTLKTLYGEQLVLLTIHAGSYSTPDATGDFTADFRTQEGAELNSFFGFPGYPMGMVNRTEFDGFRILLKDSWEAAAAIQTDLEAQVEIIITNTYNTGTSKLDCLLETEFLKDMDGTYNICVFIVESGIISPQETEQGVNLTYEHNHVLRGSMNGTWGDVVGTDGQAISGSALTNSYSYTIPDGWNADNCSVVAFVYNTTTNEVVQAEEKDLLP
ncbi:MAG: Omp28 family outer membrane lipoprotein [Bacteroidales bacterium]|nr:Omp28 family outer membrane lipoprotein [Bacteroidales bacterium]